MQPKDDNSTPTPAVPVAKPGLTNEMKVYIALFFVATLGGAIRKWFTTSNAVSNAVLLIQMLLPFVMFLWRSNGAVSPFGKYNILLLYFAYLFYHIIHPLQLTFYHGIFGVITHGGFWLLMFFYVSNRHLFKPGQLMRLFLVVGIVEVVLGFTQYALPPTHFLNRYANMKIIKDVATVGDSVRITGTFSYLSGFTAYLLFVAFFIWATIRLKYPAWITVVGITFALITGFMTGSRTATVMTMLMVGPVLVQEYSLQLLLKFLGRLIIPATLFFMFVLTNNQFPLANRITKAYDNFMDRVESNRESGEEQSRLNNFVYLDLGTRFKHPFLGVGLGSTYQGATFLFGTSPYVSQFGYAEDEYTRQLLEGGYLLLLLKFILSIVLVQQLAFKGIMRVVVWLLFTVVNPIVFNVHNAAFIALGLILVDNIYWRQEQAKRAAWHRMKLENDERLKAAAPEQVVLPA